MLDGERIRSALRDAGIGAWALYDFRGSNPIFWQLLGVPPRGTTRRAWLVLRADGEPVLLTSALDRDLLADAGVELFVYRRWQELFEELERRLSGAGRVAMEYSPGGALPIVSWADAGSVELVRSFGVEVISSGDLFQAVAAAWDEQALSSHREAVRHVLDVRDLVLAAAAPGVRESELAALVLEQFERRGLETEGSPAVAVGPNAGNPHYEARPGADAAVAAGEVLLLDLWARVPGERNVFGDVTWMAFHGDTVPARVQEVFDAVAAGRDAALELLRSGATLRGCDVDRACRDVIEAAGYGDAFIHRTGHSLGPGPRIHGLGANLDDFETRDERALLPGTGFTIEPGIYLPEFGVRLECDVFWHPGTGPEVTTPVQTEPQLLS